jgi:hypothetical protein
MFLKDDSDLMATPLPGEPAAQAVVRGDNVAAAVTALYKRLGGLLEALASKTGVDAATVIAIWLVESGGRSFIAKRACIRFEVHQLFERWGKRNRQQFDAHFRFGGHNLQAGRPWENQEFRTEDPGAFSAVHHNQNSEYAALTLAQVLAGDEIALSCASIGGSQILIGSYSWLGYESARQMYDSFQESERSHVLGFFDFCHAKPAPRVGDLVRYLQGRDWLNLAKFYNGPGQIQEYARRVEIYREAAAVLLGRKDAA